MASGPGIRDDSGVYEGWEVPIYYDPMISKLVAWGDSRNAAIARLQRALLEHHVGGIRTTVPFFQDVLKDEEFQNGDIDTDFIARFLERKKAKANRSDTDDASNSTGVTSDHIAAAFVAAAEFIKKTRIAALPSVPDARKSSRWKLEGRMSGVRTK